MERDARWDKLMREEEERKRAVIEAEKARKEYERVKKEKEDNQWWWDLENANEWETRLLPEGWSPFGQWNFPVIRERNKHSFTEEDI